VTHAQVISSRVPLPMRSVEEISWPTAARPQERQQSDRRCPRPERPDCSTPTRQHPSSGGAHPGLTRGRPRLDGRWTGALWYPYVEGRV